MKTEFKANRKTLIEFLENLDGFEQFDMSQWVSDYVGCTGIRCCLLGWTPAIFDDHFRWAYSADEAPACGSFVVPVPVRYGVPDMSGIEEAIVVFSEILSVPYRDLKRIVYMYDADLDEIIEELKALFKIAN